MIRRRRLGLARPSAPTRPSLIFFGLVAMTLVGAVLAWFGVGNPTVNVMLIVIGGWLVSLTLHEYAHAMLAYRNGDYSVAERGYLTLNLLKYTHPILSIAFPVFFLLIGGIGLPGGAVWIDRHAIRTRAAHSWISLAGPGVNLLFGLLMVVPFWFVDEWAHPVFWAGWAFLAFLQITAAALNLLPIPGLDGGNALRPWLDAKWGHWFDVFAPYGMLLLLVLIFEPSVNRVFFAVVFWFCELIGIPAGWPGAGQLLFQFWR